MDGLTENDPGLAGDGAQRAAKARAGWTHILATLPVRDGMTKCAADHPHP